MTATPIHADRDHATWSASSASRNFKCPGALALTMHLPETTNEAADWGTVCHQIAEHCLRTGSDADSLIGGRMKGKKHSFEVDEEMAETAQVYVDYVKNRVSAPGAKLWIEQKFSLADLKPPFDAGGTGDAVIYTPDAQMLEVVDLKGGRGVVVTAKGNPQLRTYALGAMLANKGLSVATVKVTIVQPRAGHPEGRVRSETFHVADLMDWTTDMLEAMRKSKEAIVEHGYISEAAWVPAYLSPGDHCADTFCKAAGTCPALAQRAMDAAGIWFNDLDDPRMSNAPDQGTPDERGKRLDMLDMIEDWIKAVRAHEHREAEMGQPATGYILVEKLARETWKEDAEETALAACQTAGLPEAKYLKPGKLRTPKQVRKELGAKAALVDGLSVTPSAGTNLVRAEKTTRPAVQSGVDKHFSVLE